MSDLADRLLLLKQRLQTAYDGIGQSYGRPFVYFVYPPAKEQELQRLVSEELVSSPPLVFLPIDVLQQIIGVTAGQEQQREQLLGDPRQGKSAAGSLFGRWSLAIAESMREAVATQTAQSKPVLLLNGLAALHPLGTPTSLMEMIAEQETRHPQTNMIVPVLLFVPGVRPPQTSREYLFLGQERMRQSFYRGEEL